jgi:hypothetical protein
MMNRENSQFVEVGFLGGPIVLAVMGAFVALWPPEATDTFGKFVWVAAFVVAGAIALFAAIQSSRNSKREIRALLGHGNNFCFFKIRPEDATDLTIAFPLYLEAVGGPVHDMNYWISPRFAVDGSAEYYSLDQRKPLRQIVHHGVTLWDKALPVGAYQIDFDCRNGWWRQALLIFIDNEKLRQVIRIEDKHGELLYEEDT